MKIVQKLSFILASSSNRRIELLNSLGLKFKVIPSKIKENNNIIDSPEKIAELNSYKKAYSISQKYKDRLVAGFDTIVVIKNKILGKPKDRDDAYKMLKMLSGNKHLVITGFSIVNLEKEIKITKSVSTEVWFKNLDSDEINWYLSTEEPYDKAGAYAIQGKGAFMVKKINGSYTNVVGLPLTEFIETLKGLIDD